LRLTTIQLLLAERVRADQALLPLLPPAAAGCGSDTAARSCHDGAVT
jgi:hypothetical protein